MSLIYVLSCSPFSEAILSQSCNLEMGSISIPSLPCFDLDRDPNSLVPGTEERKLLCQSIRTALEEHGCILVNYGKITGEEREEMVAAMRSMFDLPAETKRKNASNSPYHTYVAPNPVVPYYEAMSVLDASLPEGVQAFTDLMWPDGNDKFWRTFTSTSKKLLDLAETIMDLIINSYGVDSHFTNKNVIGRMTKYLAPAKGEPALGLTPHIDGNSITILSQNEVDGLLLRSREGEWMKVSPGKSFVVFVGQTLQAWSNGRLYAPLHKVTLNGDKDRYTFTFFIMPKEDQVVEAPHELVNDENPPRFKPFIFKDFLQYGFVKHFAEGTLEEFAGI